MKQNSALVSEVSLQQSLDVVLADQVRLVDVEAQLGRHIDPAVEIHVHEPPRDVVPGRRVVTEVVVEGDVAGQAVLLDQCDRLVEIARDVPVAAVSGGGVALVVDEQGPSHDVVMQLISTSP
jgi:hypothetical protein